MTRVAYIPERAAHQKQIGRAWHSTSMTESRAWKLWLGRRDNAGRDFLMGQYDRLAGSEVMRLRLVHGSSQYDDAMNEGRISLYSALTQYDPARGIKFITFATNVLRFDLLKYARRQKQSRSYRGTRETIYGATCRLAAQGIDKPDDEQVAREAGFSERTVRLARLSNYTTLNFGDINEGRSNDSGENAYDLCEMSLESIAGPTSLCLRNPAEVVAAEGGAIAIDAGGRGIYDLIEKLPAHLRASVRGRLIEEKSFHQIADEEGCSYQTARLWYLRGLSIIRKSATPLITGDRSLPKSALSQIPNGRMRRKVQKAKEAI